ncbi:hypothetical protein F7Q99_28205 [Streptomyces kaniharaensis]|uniref:Uncharacterized protein n=1 Tax=Streptomyces kaniharaensis TaxID=212423 RepID=A0A6N7L1G7_9ACTN|nr:hypothetical protein [Streptomyces kaniharaensis]MQS16024.1 hypothetical protein [Streptomyces kaniharaensis]
MVCINTPLSPGSYAEWSAALATFLGWDVYRPGTDHQPQPRMKDLTGPVVHVLRGARTKLCLVDGIDRLGPADLQPTFDYFDHLGDELGGLTVFWNGLGSSDILREARTRSSPLRRVTEKTTTIRPRTVPTLWVNRIPGRSKEHPDEWVKVLVSLNELLRLHRQPAKGLLDHEEFLYLATDGLMEHLVPLTGTAAQLAILGGDEAITSNLLKEAAAYLDIPTPPTPQAPPKTAEPHLHRPDPAQPAPGQVRVPRNAPTTTPEALRNAAQRIRAVHAAGHLLQTTARTRKHTASRNPYRHHVVPAPILPTDTGTTPTSAEHHEQPPASASRSTPHITKA